LYLPVLKAMSGFRLTVFIFSFVSVTGGHLDYPLIASDFVACRNATDVSFTFSCAVSIGPGAREGSQTVFFSIEDANTVCSEISPTGAECSISVHAADSCDGPFGESFYDSELTVDPWHEALQYGANMVGQNIEVASGVDFADLFGKFVIVNDADGNPLACAPLVEPPHVDTKLLKTEISVYPEYTGNFRVSGEVTLTDFERGSGIYNFLQYELDGTDSDCIVSGDAPNSCGVHVHSGTSCDVASDVGGHYYVKDGRNDPWKPITYFSLGGRAHAFTVPVETGFTTSDLDGRAIVVHDYDGGRIGCGILRPHVFSSAWPGFPQLALMIVGFALVFQ